MYRRILAAVDGSRAARLAFDEAVEIARVSGATVVTICVVEHPPQLIDVGAVYQADESVSAEAVTSATAALDEAEEVLRENGVEGVCRAVDAYGESIASVLARVAEECEADLITMGTHGRRGVRRVLLGSVAESLLRMTPLPVLLVRHDAEDGKRAVKT
jgi:nucleotide-binding universal stress UspA family protein